MPEEQWKTHVVYDPDGTGTWLGRKKWHWSVWHWTPDETADYRFGDERTKEKAHRAAVKAQLEMESHVHIVTGSSSEIYEAAREVVAAWQAGDEEALAAGVMRLDAAIDRGRVIQP